MKKAINLIIFIMLAGCNSSPQLPQAVKDKISYDLEKYPDTKEEILELISFCGPGVVEGAGENKCGFYYPAVNEYVLRPINSKTGYIYDPKEPYKSGATFFEPKNEPVPASFNLIEQMVGGAPEIMKQRNNDCWACSTTQGFEVVRAVHDQKPIELSTQTVISCSGSGTAAHGGYMSAVGYLLNGLPIESDFPYIGKDIRCKYTKEEQSWVPKVISAPYIGSSKGFSRFKKGNFDLTDIEMVKRAMYQFKGSAVVTVAAFNVGKGVYDVSSQCNSGGNHMVNISGWEPYSSDKSKTVAHVYNSWGNDFGEKGVGKILWNPKDGCLNRGLGVSARVIQYKSPCTPAVADIGFTHKIILSGSSVKMGKKQENVQCSWSPTIGLSDPNSCETYATPEVSTEYHLSVKNNCGTSSAMALVEVYGPKGRINDKLLTPFGETTFNGETE